MAGTSWVTKTNKHNQKRKKADREKMLRRLEVQTRWTAMDECVRQLTSEIPEGEGV